MATVTFTLQTDVRDNLGLYTALLAGDDFITLSSFADIMRGFAGDDVMWGNGGDDRLFGDQGADTISGGAGNDVIQGGTGRDRLTGGTGSDMLSGGADRVQDVFVFLTAADSRVGTARDRIAQFVPGIDDIDLSRIDADTSRPGDQAFLFSGSGPRAHAVWTVDTGADLILRADINGDRAADFEVTVTATARMAAGDFVL
jgi:Ca2+-binding RTX toxin-like protein